MKDLNQYIQEKYLIDIDTKDPFKYTCQPQNEFELRKILEERLKKDKNADLNDIDVSKITDMGAYGGKGLFENLDPHDIEINNWDVRNVEKMQFMFTNCKNFKGKGLENWNVSKVTDMGYMFYGCKKFNADLNNWKTLELKKMDRMFDGCKSLKNKPNWYKE